MRRSSVKALNEKQWSAIRVWSEANEGQLAKIRTIEMAVALMMDAGIQCSADILRGSSSFMAVWNRTRPKPGA